MRKLEIYIHIPFCARKCAYCDFLSFPAGVEQQKQYVEALLEEIRRFPAKEKYAVCSVFFGGGTPSLIQAEWIVDVMELLKREFRMDMDAELSIECNPGTADAGKLEAYRRAGINRISFGLQSAKDEELSLLGRIHTWEDFLRTYEAARAVGFENINVDLMSALPGQTVESWKETLESVLALRPQHISAYSLIIEEGTPFYERYAEDARRREDGEETEILPSEKAEREMYRLTEEMLGAAGMHRYEISNYALPGYECRHNIGYWDGTEYVGFGLGASSMLSDLEKSKKAEREKASEDGEHEWTADAEETENTEGSGEKRQNMGVRYVRIRNTDSMDEYLNDPAAGRETDELSIEDRMAEFMFLGLRMIQGVSEAEFQQRFGMEMDAVYGDILKKYQKFGLVERMDGRIFLTVDGLDVSNAVMAEFLL